MKICFDIRTVAATREQQQQQHFWNILDLLLSYLISIKTVEMY